MIEIIHKTPTCIISWNKSLLNKLGFIAYLFLYIYSTTKQHQRNYPIIFICSENENWDRRNVNINIRTCREAYELGQIDDK